MIRSRFITASFSLALAMLLTGVLAGTAAAQDSRKKDAKSDLPASRGLAERLSGAWGETVEPEAETLLTAGTAAARKIGKVDRRRLEELEERLEMIRRMEADLQNDLRRLDQKQNVILETWPEPDLAGAPLDADRLDDERRTLLALESELARRQEAARLRRAAREREQKAKRATKRSSSLLDADFTVPPPPAEKPDERPTGGRHAVRLADALYRAGDHRGAVRQYEAAQAAKNPQMNAERLYRLARCYELLGDFSRARTALDALTARESDPKSFWNRRAAKLRELLDKSESLQKLLRSEKP
jgi:tetratricopeptide (TPR) repeat protein